ncbi:hypothetical protein JCM10213_003280 [Rhodosporidiobolus nylandii]
MPVPPLANELITRIFEHLYCLLRVVPEKEFLDVPLDAHSTFFPLLVVSRTWHQLALPFFYRHLSSDDVREADRTSRFWRSDNLSRVKSFELAVDRLHWIEEWRDDASSLAAGLECLFVRDARLGTSQILVDYLIPAFVEASASTLTHLSFGSFRIAIVPRTPPIPYAALLPFPLPELLSLRLPSVADVQEATFSESPQLQVLSFTGNYNGANTTLPNLPPSLRHLVLQFSYADDALPFLRDIRRVPLAHLTTLGFELPDHRDEVSPRDVKLLEVHTPPLLQRCCELGVKFHSDFLPPSAFEIPPLAASTDDVVRARLMAGSAASSSEGEESESEDDGEQAETEDEQSDDGEDSQGGALVHDDSIASSGSPAMSADEYEDDWDAEDGKLARARWSPKRRMEFAFKQAYPDPLAHFPSIEVFEAAKGAAIKAMKPFLRGDAGGSDEE